jgi:hypothetical protein
MIGSWQGTWVSEDKLSSAPIFISVFHKDRDTVSAVVVLENNQQNKPVYLRGRADQASQFTCEESNYRLICKTDGDRLIGKFSAGNPGLVGSFTASIIDLP